MTHQEAVEQLAIERYLLGELTGESRNRFEEHLFDCAECAADLRESVAFAEALRAELPFSIAAQPAAQTVVLPRREPRRSPLSWLWQPWTLVPALAACLAVIVYQSTVVLPGVRSQVATTRTPQILTPLVLANAAARGAATIPEITATRHGYYLLAVDIPPAPDASAYRCTLISPQGKALWQVDVTPEQAQDTVTIQVPVMTAAEGIDELRVQAVPPTGTALEPLASYKYRLSFAQ